MSASLHPAAARHLCQITWPRLEYLRNLEAKGRMADALKELQMMDGDISYLSAEHRQVLERAESIKEQLSLVSVLEGA